MDFLKQAKRFLLRALGQGALLHELEVKNAAIEYLCKLNNVDIAISESDLIEVNGSYKLRVFFVMPNKVTYHNFLSTYYEIYLDETRKYLEQFNASFGHKVRTNVLKMSDYILRRDDTDFYCD